MRRKQRDRGRRGNTACELAIVLPFLMFLTLIAVDYCRIYYEMQTVSSAARSGALMAGGIAHGSPTQTATQAATAAVLAETTNLQPPVKPEDVSVTFATDSATVIVTRRFRTLVPYPGIPSSTDLRVKVVMPRSPQQ